MLMKFYKGSILFTLVCLALGAWYGWAMTGNAAATASMLWIIVVLSILEVSLSFDNAVVNAAVLKDMDDIWQRRFLTWGMVIAVFGMRIVFPLAIVAIAAGLGPVDALNLSLNNPAEYERIVNSAHVGIAGFGGAFGAASGSSLSFGAGSASGVDIGSCFDAVSTSNLGFDSCSAAGSVSNLGLGFQISLCLRFQ